MWWSASSTFTISDIGFTAGANQQQPVEQPALGKRRLLRLAILLFVWALLTLPFAFALTIATFPFWRWLDLNTSLESFGHSGPAEWCFWLVYGILLVAGLGVAGRSGHRSSKRRPLIVRTESNNTDITDNGSSHEQ